MIHITIDDAEIISVNKITTNQKWVAQATKNKVHKDLHTKKVSNGIEQIKEYPLYAFFIITVPTKRKRDVDNILVKYYLDYLVREGILEDDNMFLIPFMAKALVYEKGVKKLEVILLHESELQQGLEIVKSRLQKE